MPQASFRLKPFLIERVFRKDFLFFLICLIAAYLLFKNLGNIYLWTDEAITAVTARTVMKTGVPRGHDGPNWIDRSTIEKYFGYFQGDILRAQPWGQFYLTALSFYLFGPSQWSARLPFTLIGLLCVILIYHLARLLFEHEKTARFSALLLTTCVPFLLHARQCRYFTPSIFFAMLSIYFYIQWVWHKKHPARLALSLIVLNYFTYGTFLPVFGALGLHWLLFERNNTSLKQTLFWIGFVLINTIPWILFGKTYQYSDTHHLIDLWKYIRFEFRVLTKYIFPFSYFAAVFALGFFLKRKFWFKLETREKKALVLLLIFIGINLAFYPFCGIRVIHYFIHLAPILCILMAFIFSKWWTSHRWFVTISVVLLIFTNFLTRPNGVFAYAPDGTIWKKIAGEKTRPRSYFLDYLYEIHHDYNGPIEAMVNFLRKNARAGDHVKVAYGDVPLMFYLPNLVYEKENFYENETTPEWFIDREVWQDIYMAKFKNNPVATQKAKAYLERLRNTYDRIELDAVDIMWENRPNDMEYHRFRTETNGKKVVIYQRKDVARRI